MHVAQNCFVRAKHVDGVRSGKTRALGKSTINRFRWERAQEFLWSGPGGIQAVPAASYAATRDQAGMHCGGNIRSGVCVCAWVLE